MSNFLSYFKGNYPKSWYTKLKKPSWTPRPKTIGTIWSILYPIILVTYGIVVYDVVKGELSVSFLTPFIINIVANLLFTPILFGLKNLRLALFDIAIVWVTIVWTIFELYTSGHTTLALWQLPYFVWVSIASYLQFYLTTRN